MQFFTEMLRFAAISQLLLLGFLLLGKGGHRQFILPTSLFCFSVISYLMVDWGQLPAILHHLFLAPTFAMPYFFWLFSKSLFDDHFRLERWMFWTLATLLALLLANFYIGQCLDMETATYKILRMLHHGLSLFFVVLGLMEAARNRAADLLVARLQFRGVFILLTALPIAGTVLSELAFPLEAPAVLGFIQKLTIACLTFFFAARRLEFKAGFYNETELPPPPPPKPEPDPRLAAQLMHLVEVEKIYRTEGLTIRALAEKMEVKEYRLRQTINRRLGFRNFNDFLNSYRIDEACSLLTDPARPELTVLEIAYEVGYNSLAPFNKAFREITGMTPTEYRRRNRP